jgi:ribokinase
MKRVCVVGSFMIDVVMRVARRPRRGETLYAEACGVFLGGKGFNQAVAARRMGAAVAMVGRLGDDPFGRRIVAALAAEGIDAEGVIADPAEGTGLTTPLVEADGSNSIVVAPRANLRLTPTDVERAAGQIRAADVLLLQLEVPPEASAAAARIARAAGRRVVLNPAPALPLPDTLLQLADILTPNEVEAAMLTGLAVEGVEAAFAAAETLRARARPAAVVVVTLGALGAVARGPDLYLHTPAHAVTAVDTTAAGDAYNGALAVALAEGCPLPEALRWANAAGALAVTRLGAEPSLPRRADVAALLAAHA